MRAFLFPVAACIFLACERKSLPAATHSSSTRVASTPPAAPTVMVDGSGKLVNKSAGSGTTAKVYAVTNARSFTPNQQKNLMYRFKTIPPKVLHVPDTLAQRNARGTFYVYKKQFWYWKKADGFFYLDENYYN